MHKYVIRDVWMAIKLSLKNFFSLMFVFIGIPIFIMITFGLAFDYLLYPILFIVAILFIQSIIIYRANNNYIIDLETGEITFPRSDIENSIIAIILCFPYWNLMRRKTIHASEIDNLYLDTMRWTTKTETNGKTQTHKHVYYTINLVGKFGSANFKFLTRQKRDEVRNAINQCVKQHKSKNIDSKVAELE